MGHFIWGPDQNHFGSSLPHGLNALQFQKPSHQPRNCVGTMALDTKTADLATKAKVTAKVLERFVTNDILTCEDVGLFAAEEKQVDKNIIETMLCDGVDELKSAGKKVAVKKCWTYCRAVYDADRAPKVTDPTMALDDSIPDDHDVDVAAK